LGFPDKNTAPGETLKELVSTAIEKLTAIGLHVRVVLCDQGATNQQMFKMFGISSKQPTAQIEGKNVVSC